MNAICVLSIILLFNFAPQAHGVFSKKINKQRTTQKALATDIKAIGGLEEKNGNSALIRAIDFQKPALALWLLQQDPDAARRKSSIGSSPLFLATKRNLPNVVQALIELQANAKQFIDGHPFSAITPDQHNHYGKSLLYLAVQQNFLEVARLLLIGGALVNFKKTEQDLLKKPSKNKEFSLIKVARRYTDERMVNLLKSHKKDQDRKSFKRTSKSRRHRSMFGNLFEEAEKLSLEACSDLALSSNLFEDLETASTTSEGSSQSDRMSSRSQSPLLESCSDSDETMSDDENVEPKKKQDASDDTVWVNAYHA